MYSDGNARDLYRAREAVSIERRRVRQLEAEVFVLRMEADVLRAIIAERGADYRALVP